LTGKFLKRVFRVVIFPLWLVFGVYAVAVLVLTWLLLMALVVFLPANPGGARLARRLSGVWAWIVMSLWGVIILAEGRGNLKSGVPVLLASSHAGWADTTILMAALGGDFLFLAMKEMMRWPTIGRSMEKAEHLFVDRSSFARGRAVGAMAAALKRGRSVLVFPEGGFLRAPGLRPFALGGFRAAAEAGVGVVPIALGGTRKIIQGGIWIPRPGIVRVTLGESLLPREDSREEAERLRDAARAFIAGHCGEPDSTVVPPSPGE